MTRSFLDMVHSMKKLILVISLSVFTATSANAACRVVSLKERVQKADLIILGKAEKIEQSWTCSLHDKNTGTCWEKPPLFQSLKH